MCIGYTQIFCHFMQGTSASVDFGITGGPGAYPRHTPRDDCMEKGIQEKTVEQRCPHIKDIKRLLLNISIMKKMHI